MLDVLRAQVAGIGSATASVRVHSVGARRNVAVRLAVEIRRPDTIPNMCAAIGSLSLQGQLAELVRDRSAPGFEAREIIRPK